MTISLPYTFTNNTIADADQVNANFQAVATAVRPETFGAKGDGVTDDTTAIQAAVDAAAATAYPNNGGTVFFKSSIYVTRGITMKSRVKLLGCGAGVSILKLKDGTNASLLTIPTSSTQYSWCNIGFDGNRANNTSGHCIYFVAGTGGYKGGEHTVDKLDQANYSEINAYCSDFSVANAAQDGINMGFNYYAVFMDKFSVIGCKNGMRIGASDCMFSNFYSEGNDESGLINTAPGNKYINAKVIWNGRSFPQTAGAGALYSAIYETSRATTYSAVESQDNHCTGWILTASASFCTLQGCISDTDGYSSVVSSAGSSRIAYGYYIDGYNHSIIGCRALGYRGRLLDGNFATEWPFYVNHRHPIMQIDYDGTKFNDIPQGTAYEYINRYYNGCNFKLSNYAGGSNEAFLNLDVVNVAYPNTPSYIDLFRRTQTNSPCILRVMPGDNTSNTAHSIDGKGNMIAGVNGGGWNTPHFQIGSYNIWVDSDGKLRMKSGNPTSDTDGTVVGTQA